MIWLTSEQGGRSSGVPATTDGHDYAATAFVPPQTAGTALASFLLRVADRGAWASTARAGWLTVRDDPRFGVQPGMVVVVTEGPRPVGYFHVGRIVEPDAG